MEGSFISRHTQLRAAVYHRNPDLVAGADRAAVALYLTGSTDMASFAALSQEERRAYGDVQQLMSTATPWGRALFALGQIRMTPGIQHLTNRLALAELRSLNPDLEPDDEPELEDLEQSFGELELGELQKTFVELYAHSLVKGLIDQHRSGHWGEVGEEDQETNDHGVRFGGRLMSAYRLGYQKEKVWVITEWDRSYTTVLLPQEY